jgi:hypothetical protein
MITESIALSLFKKLINSPDDFLNNDTGNAQIKKINCTY